MVEYIYPTSFEDQGKTQSQAETNGTVTTQGKPLITEEVVVPQDFATREVGAILTAKPELDSTKRIVNVTLTPNCVFEPVWRNFGIKSLPGKQPVPMEQPFFPVATLTTEISMTSDSVALIGGGTPTADGTKMTYMLATVRLLDAKGNPVAKRARTGHFSRKWSYSLVMLGESTLECGSSLPPFPRRSALRRPRRDRSPALKISGPTSLPLVL